MGKKGNKRKKNAVSFARYIYKRVLKNKSGRGGISERKNKREERGCGCGRSGGGRLVVTGDDGRL